jgi:hypothetical protein
MAVSKKLLGRFCRMAKRQAQQSAWMQIVEPKTGISAPIFLAHLTARQKVFPLLSLAHFVFGCCLPLNQCF